MRGVPRGAARGAARARADELCGAGRAQLGEAAQEDMAVALSAVVDDDDRYVVAAAVRAMAINRRS